MASSTAASEPGRTKWCSVATLAVSVRRGSNNDQPPAPRLEVADPLREVRDGHQRAVGGHRVGAEHQEERRPVDVRDGQHQLVAVELPGHELVRDLVDRRGAEPVAGPQGLHERHSVGREADRVHVRVAEVDAHRVGAVLLDRRGQPVGHQVVGLVPTDLLPARVVARADPAHRPSEPVGVGVDVGHRHALGADVAAGERVRVVASDPGDDSRPRGSARSRRSPRRGCRRPVGCR